MLAWNASISSLPVCSTSACTSLASSVYIGNQPGFKIAYEIDRHAILDAEISYFISGPFIEETGDSPNIFHLAATLSYRF